MASNRVKFIVVLACLLVLGFSLTSLSGYYTAQKSLSNQVSQTALPLTSDTIYSEIQRDLLLPVTIASGMAKNAFVRKWMRNDELPGQDMISYLRELKGEYNAVTSFYVSAVSHRYYHPDGVLRRVSEDNPSDQWYFRFVNSKRPYELNIDHDTAQPNRLIIFINYRVLDRQGDLLGVTGVGLLLSDFIKQIKTYQERYQSNISLIDRDGLFVISTAPGFQQQTLDQIEGLASHKDDILSQSPVRLSVIHKNKTLYLNSRFIKELDWHLVVTQESARNEGLINKALFSNLAIGLSICAIVLMITHLTLSRYQVKLEEMATTDNLTGLSNRHIFQPVYDQITRNATRYHHAVTLGLIDLDHFKKINDDYGHQAGDQALKSVAGIIRNRLRDSDTICRWGGEEFLIILPECSATMAAQLVETIRSEIEKTPVIYNNREIRMTASFGLSEQRKDEDQSSLLKRVDEALYKSKNQGRNRITVL